MAEHVGNGEDVLAGEQGSRPGGLLSSFRPFRSQAKQNQKEAGSGRIKAALTFGGAAVSSFWASTFSHHPVGQIALPILGGAFVLGAIAMIISFLLEDIWTI